MDLQEIEKQVIGVVCEVLNIDADQVTSASRFVADLGAESIQSIQLVSGLEEKFDIEMDTDEALEVQTVGDAVGFIAKYVTAK